VAHLTRFGLQIPSFTYPNTGEGDLFERVGRAAEVAETSGFDSLWVMDHFFQIPFVGEPSEPMFEAYTLLGALAVKTNRARIGAMVTGVTYRNPALLAKEVTALDVLSGGRAVLGIGAAWFAEEHTGLGFEFPPVRERFERLEEALEICRLMFTQDSPSFEGRHYTIHQAFNRPRPLQPAGPPILVGGSGERRTLRLVAKYADACNLFGDVKTIEHKLSVLERHCEEVGRDPDSVTKTRLGTLVIAESAKEVDDLIRTLASRANHDEETVRRQVIAGVPDSVVEQVSEYFEAGLDGLVFNMPNPFDDEAVQLAGTTLTAAFGGLGPH
jgi:F420-dependent oxidoreductase-like protein